MINTVECPLYNLQSKKMLKHLLRINNNNLLKQTYISSLINPYIETSGKPRLIEAPHENLKVVQRHIKHLLNKIVVPDNVFSGIQGRSYVDNVCLHMGNRNLFKIDLTAFFPSIHRNTVYQFFYKDLACSPDIAQILTNLTTINLMDSKSNNLEQIFQFLNSKNVFCYNHLISGAPTSQILSYLANYHMFDEIQRFADSNHITMSIYVDDITFSSENKISHYFRENIFSIIRKYNYQISKTKVKKYTKSSPKLVTGVIIDSSGYLTIKNSLRLKIIKEFAYLQQNPNDFKSRKRLQGLLIAARQINPNAYSSIQKYIK